MQDTPNPTEILAAVAVLLRETIMPLLSGHPQYQIRVAANALDLASRQITLQPEYDIAEHESLKALLGRDGSLVELNQALCAAIERHEITLESPGLAEHLWATTMAKLAVDQPGYARYQRELTGR
jgi:Domain of unknown function (DUF6285)